MFLEHETGEHPENGRRMMATLALLEECGLLAKLSRIDARDATPDELALVHDARYVEAVHQAARDGGGWVDPDTLITPRSYDVAARVVGATLVATDAVMAGDAANAFCLVRPPGHHATPAQAMGFCLFNHVAVAAQYARTKHGLDRVAIVDYDVHHGNGTQDAFYDDPSSCTSPRTSIRSIPAPARQARPAPARGAATTSTSRCRTTPATMSIAARSSRSSFPRYGRFRPQLILVSAGL